MSRTRIFLITVLAIAAAYGLCLRNDFVFDDLIFVTRDPRVQSITETPRLFVEPLWGFTDAPGNVHVHQYYRPLQTVPLAINLAVAGPAAWLSHLFSLCLHTLNALLLVSLLLRLGARRDAAVAGALLWALHPGLSEAVLWISDLAGLGAALAILAVVLLHMDQARRTCVRAGGIAAVLLLGLLFKEVAVIAPILAVTHDTLVGRFLGGKAQRRGLYADYAAMLVVLAVYAGLRVRALGGLVPGLADHSLAPAALVWNGFGLVPEYLHTFFWPFDLNMYHDFLPVTGFTDPRVWIGLGASAAVVAGFCVALARGKPSIAFALAWIALTTLPYLLVRWPKLNVYAERYTYLPAMGASMLLALSIPRWIDASGYSRRLSAAALALILGVFVCADVLRALDWRDEVTLYTRTLREGSRAELVRNNLALRYLELGRYRDGIHEIEKLLAIDPEFAEAHHNLGLLSLAIGDSEGALTAFRRARELAPTKPETLLNLGYTYDKLGRHAQAAGAYRRLVSIDPGHVAAWYNLALTAVQAGQFEHAREAVTRVLEFRPHDPDARSLLAKLPSARTATETSRAPKPITRRRCAKARAMIDAGRHRDAEELLQGAAWLDAASALPHHYLSNLYYLTGRPGQALRETRAALARAPHNALYRNNMLELEALLATQRPADPAP